MQSRPFILRPTTFAAPRSPAGRMTLESQAIDGRSDTALSDYQDSLATSKLDRLADELRALGIDF